ncbi:hypothetical protein LEMLEM_LOCUS19889 [Lemmus lemmus]
MLNCSGSVRGWWRTPCSRLSISIWKKHRAKSSWARGTPPKLKRPIRMAKAVIITGSESGTCSRCSVKSIHAPLLGCRLTYNVLSILFKPRRSPITFMIDVLALLQHNRREWGVGASRRN